MKKSIFDSKQQNYYKKLLLKTTVPRDELTQIDKRIYGLNTYVKQYAPEKLFRLRSYNDYSIEELENESIYLPRPSEFNDIFDTYIRFDKEKLIDFVSRSASPQSMERFINSTQFSDGLLPAEFSEEMAKLAKEYDFLKVAPMVYPKYMEHVRNNVEKLVESVRNTVVCSCFTENIYAPTMWGYYADSGKGFAIEYDLDEHVFGIRKVYVDPNHYGFFSIMPVIYSKDQLDANEYANQLLMELCSPHLIPNLRTKDYLWKTKIALFKDDDWRLEKEWRIVSTFEEFTAYDNTHNLSGKYPYPPSAVYLGYKMDEEHEMKVLGIAYRKRLRAYRMAASADAENKLRPDEIDVARSVKENKVILLKK